MKRPEGGKWVLGSYEGSEVGNEVHRESKDRDFNEEGSNRQCFLSEPKLTVRQGQTKPTDTP